LYGVSWVFTLKDGTPYLIYHLHCIEIRMDLLNLARLQYMQTVIHRNQGETSMKAKLFHLLIIVMLMGIEGCSTMNTGSSAIEELPVVKLGQEAPKDGEYVLLLPSGTDIPVTVSISGSLLSKESKTNATVQLKRDVYLYKKQTSFDGKTWGEKNINLQIGTGIGVDGGKVNVTVDEIVK
jgi:hypothetical protein